MYGLGNGFGGMPYQSPAGAIVAGITAGGQYWDRVHQEQDRKERLQYERDREDRLDRMQQAHTDWMERNTDDRDQRERSKEALEATKIERENLSNDGQALLEQYGGDWKNVPEADRVAHGARIADYNSRFDGLMQAIYGKYFQQGTNQAQANLRNFSDGTLDPTNPEHGQQLVQALVGATHRDPAEYLKAGKEPSTVEQNLADFHDGMMGSGDYQKVASGMNGIFGNQAEGGRLGRLDQTGGVVTGVQFNQDRPFVPNIDGTGFHPAFTTSAQHTNGAVTTTPYAPPTIPGNEDPKQLQTVTPQKIMDYCGRLGSVAAICNHPAVQASIRQALQNPDQATLDLAHAQTALGMSLGKKGPARIEKIDRDDGGVDGYAVSNDGATWKKVFSGPANPSKVKQPREDVGAQKLSMGLEVLKDQLQRGDIDQAGYEERVLELSGAGKPAPLVTPGQAHEVAKQSEIDAEEDYGVIRSNESPTGYLWARPSTAKEGQPGFHAPNVPLTATEVADMHKTTRPAYEKRYNEALGERRGATGIRGQGAAPPAAAPAAAPAAPPPPAHKLPLADHFKAGAAITPAAIAGGRTGIAASQQQAPQ